MSFMGEQAAHTEQTARLYDLMRKESNRLKTFQMNPSWPKDYVDIKKLAKAGFFYAFNGDNVHCAFCRGQVCQWDRDDDPMAEHARHFTTCPFIMGGEVGNEPIDEDPIPGPKRPRPYDVYGQFPNFPPNDERSRQELPNHEQHEQKNEVSSNLFTSVPPIASLSANDRLQTEPSQQILVSNSNQISYDCNNYNLNINKSAASNSNTNPSPHNLSGICKICYTNVIELVFLPCGHSVSCLSCAQRLFNCPCCREIITTRIRTYLV